MRKVELRWGVKRQATSGSMRPLACESIQPEAGATTTLHHSSLNSFVLTVYINPKLPRLSSLFDRN